MNFTQSKPPTAPWVGLLADVFNKLEVGALQIQGSGLHLFTVAVLDWE